jgi:hypothetical protein
MFDYKKTTIKQFTKQLNSAQRVKFFNGETKDFFTPQFIFLRALGLDRKNYKQQLNSKLVSEKEEKLSTLLGAFEYNQELLMENMIVNGKSDVL